MKDAREPHPQPSLFVALPNAPSAVALTVRNMIARVEKGAIRVPDFQRPLRWSNDDVVKLFDSILKGYPIGSLLFWKRSFSEETVTIGSAKLSVGRTEDGWHIVDGQQRITSLAAALLDLDQASDPRWEVVFDTKRNMFLSGAAAGLETVEASPDHLVPVRVLGSLTRLGRWLRDRELGAEDTDRIEQVQQRILDYEVPAYLVETDDVDALRGVFARMNSTGVRMRADEVFQALLGGGERREHRRMIDLGALQRAADIDGFGQPPRTEVLKAVLAMSDLDPSKRLDDLGEDALRRLVGGDDAEEALRRTVMFFQAPIDGPTPGAGIPAYAFIPYPVAFVILARWFYLYPRSDESALRALRQWLWRGVATGVHQRAAVSAMRFQVRQIREDDLAGSLSGLLEAVGDPSRRGWSLDPFHANHAASRVEILALLSLRPRSPLGDVSWRALLSQGERVAREIFTVVGLEGAVRTMARTAANRVLLDARPTHLVTEMRKWRWDEHEEILRSHLLYEEDVAGLIGNDVEPVLRRRAERIRSHVSRLLNEWAGLGEPRVLPLGAYVDAHELEKVAP